MKRFAVLAAGFGLCLAASMAGAQEIQTFDSPNPARGGSNFAFDNPVQGSWAGAVTPQATDVSISFPSGYGTAYYNIGAHDTPSVVNVSGSSTLQLDTTISSGDAGIFVDLQDGEGDFWQYTWGYGLTGSAAANQGGLPAGYTITQGAAPNEIIMQAPLVSPSNPISGPSFDFTQLVLFRLEDDPGAGTNNVIAFNDLSAVNVPEPASLGIGTVMCLLAARRRHR